MIRIHGIEYFCPLFALPRAEILLCEIGPLTKDPAQRVELNDTERYRLIAGTVSAVTGEPRTGQAVKNRLAAARKYAREHPGRPGPPVHPGLSMTEHADVVRRSFQEEAESRNRREELNEATRVGQRNRERTRRP